MYNVVNFNFTATLSWLCLSSLINTARTKTPIKYGAFFFLGKYWKSVRRGAVPRGCAPAGAQLQEETETVSALASLTVDVQQPFAGEDSRYGSTVGESLRSVPSRLTSLPLTCPLQSHRCHSTCCRLLETHPGKHRAGACGLNSWRNGGDE